MSRLLDRTFAYFKNCSPEERSSLLMLAAFVGVMCFTYWNTFFGRQGIVTAWDNPQYSHGYLIPVFSLALLLMRYQPLGAVSRAERWAGLGVIALSVVWRTIAAHYRVNVLDMASLIPALMGIFLLIGGWSALRWAGPPIAFLVFMFPLPMAVEFKVLSPLQSVATGASTFVLQTVGIECYREGNTIRMDARDLGVVDACSGLRMLTIFLALSVAITMVTVRSWWEKILIIASALPIALIVNIIRISVTGVLYMVSDAELAEKVFHDFAGWIMMPMALGLLYLEVSILSHLWIEEEAPPANFGFITPGQAPRPS